MNNCGGCNIKCNSGTEVCQNLACTQVICPAGVGNCDGNASNGCETDTTTLTNCGGCGVKCIAPTNMVASCTGACQYTCLDGFADCNGNLADGCEVNLKSDPYHCGACLNSVCSSTGGTPSCNDGVCQIACTGVNQNCNGQVSDGCEVNTTSDPNNCLGCGNQCYQAPHTTTAACTPSGCGVGVCQAGWDNCNGTVGDGCEVNTLGSDVNNCGGCGVKCIGGGTCNAGSCQYPVTELALVAGGGIVEIIQDTANLYWTSVNPSGPGVYKLPKVGGSPVKIASGTQPSGLAVDGGYVFWSEQSNQKIMKTSVDGSTTVVLSTDSIAPGVYTPGFFAVHVQVQAGYVYYLTREYKDCATNRSGSDLMRVPTTGGTLSGFVWSVSAQPIALSSTLMLTECGVNTGTSISPKWTAGQVSFVEPTTGVKTVSVSNLTWAAGTKYGIAGWAWSGSKNGVGAGVWHANTSTNFLGTPTEALSFSKTTSNQTVYLGAAHQGWIEVIDETAYTVKTLAVGQGTVKTMTADNPDAAYIYWVTTDVQGDHIRKASR